MFLLSVVLTQELVWIPAYSKMFAKQSMEKANVETKARNSVLHHTRICLGFLRCIFPDTTYSSEALTYCLKFKCTVTHNSSWTEKPEWHSPEVCHLNYIYVDDWLWNSIYTLIPKYGHHFLPQGVGLMTRWHARLCVKACEAINRQNEQVHHSRSRWRRYVCYLSR